MANEWKSVLYFLQFMIGYIILNIQSKNKEDTDIESIINVSFCTGTTILVKTIFRKQPLFQTLEFLS